MKLRCPRCRQKLSVPEKYAGKAVRCPACNCALQVPKLQAAIGGQVDDDGMDLGSFADLESQSTVLSRRELAKARAAEEKKRVDEATLRTCPNCKKQVHVEDPYADLLCSHCWEPIPALIKGRSASSAVSESRLAAKQGLGPGGFYPELATCFTYPVQALGSLITAAIVAIAAGLVPVAVMTGATRLMAQSSVGTAEGVQQGDLSGVTLVLLGIFGAQIFFFSAVATHVFLDVVRSTSIRNDRPPNLAWSPREWGNSFIAYLVFACYYALMSYLVATIAVDRDITEYLLKGSGGFKEMLTSGGPGLIVGLVLVSSVIPMSLIGIALGSVTQGLNPMNVLKSIGRTHAHYAFLVVLLSVYVVSFGAAFAAILFDWFLPQFDLMVAGSKEGDLAQVGLALLAWGAVMGFFYYGTYVLARLHGLFARAFRKGLQFGM
ncbi:MAG: hypothetical protein ABII12_04625 [Planctomycetota bacterium]